MLVKIENFLSLTKLRRLKHERPQSLQKRNLLALNTASYYVQIATLTLANGLLIFKVSCNVTNFGNILCLSN